LYEYYADKKSDFTLTEELKLKEDIKAAHKEDELILNSETASNEKRWALMAISDIWAMTPLRQGYTLVSLLEMCSTHWSI
jgi:hypothetical protein